MINLKVKILDGQAKLPIAANPGDAGLDLVATSIQEESEYVEYGTGLAMEIPEGHVGLLFPRSSVSKKDLILANSVGVVDSSYRGEVKLRFKRASNGTNRYLIGEKVGQLLILPYPLTYVTVHENLSETKRGEGGFGSTDKK